MKNNVIFLVIGIIISILGLYQNFQYEDHSITVEATVTDIKSTEEKDGGYKHVYYGKYTVNGKEYTDVKLETRYTDSQFPENLFVGDTVEMRVYPDSPEKKVPEGGFFGTVGLVMIVYNAVKIHKYKKFLKAEETAE